VKIIDQYKNWKLARSVQNETRAIALLTVTNPRAVQFAPRNERKLVARAVKTLCDRSKPHMVRNWYESGNPYSDGSRSYLPEVLTDARYDQNQITRREAMRRMRYWEQNSIFVKRGLDVSEQYVIGTHCPVVTSLSANTDWAAQAELVFSEMCQNAGLDGESLFSLLCVGHRRKKVDGNVLFVQTSKPGTVTIRRGTKYESPLGVMRPCYQMVESHRVGTPFAMWQEEGQDIFDGIEYGVISTQLPGGQSVQHKVKTCYWVNESANVFSVQQGFTKVPVQFAYYAAQSHRVNEPRSMTDFYAAEPTLALLEDMLKLEMKAQEVQSDIALFITNGAGQEIKPGMQSVLAALGTKVTAGVNGANPVVTTNDLEKVKTIYEKIWGGKTAVGRTGDTLHPMAPNRPAEATLNLWNFLIDSFCSASGFPRLLIFPKSQMKGQGTEVRAEIEAANAMFVKEFNLIWKPFIHQVWEYFMGWAIRNDERVKNAPADWNSIDVSHPRSIVVDLGYATAETISFLAAGLINLHQVAQQFGTTRSKIISGAVKDVFDIKLACLQMAKLPQYKGIEVDAAEVRASLGDAAQKLASSNAASEKETVSSNNES
jgi:hypothetical protein